MANHADERSLNSPVAVESKMPSKKARAIIEEQSLLRGLIIAGFAQSEFLLLDVAMKAKIIAEYWNTNLGYSHSFGGKIMQARKLFAREGFLAKYQTRLAPLLDDLEPLKEIRDFLAHGFCRIHIKGEQVSFEYKMLKKHKGGDVSLGEMVATLEELRNTQVAVTSTAQQLLLLFREIYIQESLELIGGMGEFNDPSQ